MKYSIKLLLVGILFNIIIGQLSAQQTQIITQDSVFFFEKYRGLTYKKRAIMALRSVKHLSNGTLIVRLRSQEGKIEKLNELGKHALADTIIKEQDKHNRHLIKTFKANYTFSDIVFMYGHDMKAYISGEKPYVFLNNNLEIDSTIQVKKEPVYYFGGHGTDTFYLMDDSFGVLEQPAPYAVLTEYDSAYPFIAFSAYKRSQKRGSVYLHQELVTWFERFNGLHKKYDKYFKKYDDYVEKYNLKTNHNALSKYRFKIKKEKYDKKMVKYEARVAKWEELLK